MVVGRCTGSKIGMRDEGLLIHEHILAWCMVCLGLVDRLSANVSMAWHGVVWCGAVSLTCVTKHYVDMTIMSIGIKGL